MKKVSKALLVIDIDHYDCWTPEEIKKSEERQIAAGEIKKVLKKWRANNGLIVFINLRGSRASGNEAQYGPVKLRLQRTSPQVPKDNCLVCDADEYEKLAAFLEHCHNSEFEPAFIKTTCDAFSNENLAKYLTNHEISELELIGCNTFACVLATAAGALKYGFKVKLIAKASYSLSIDTQEKADRWIHSVKLDAKMDPDAKAPISVVL